MLERGLENKQKLISNQHRFHVWSFSAIMPLFRPEFNLKLYLVVLMTAVVEELTI